VCLGRVAQNPVIQDRITKAAQLFGKTVDFPENGIFGTAIGAILEHEKQ